MSKMRFVGVAVAALALASCAPQTASRQPAPAEGPGSEMAPGLPFAVPKGALYVARSSRSDTVYRIRESCERLHSLNPERVVFFWTLEAGVRSGYQLSDEEGCR